MSRSPSVTVLLDAFEDIGAGEIEERLDALDRALAPVCGSYEVLLFARPGSGGSAPRRLRGRLRVRRRRPARGIVLLREALALGRGSVLLHLPEPRRATPGLVRGLLEPLRAGRDLVAPSLRAFEFQAARFAGLIARDLPADFLARSNFAARRHALFALLEDPVGPGVRVGVALAASAP